jgi:hypothetical protein
MGWVEYDMLSVDGLEWHPCGTASEYGAIDLDGEFVPYFRVWMGPYAGMPVRSFPGVVELRLVGCDEVGDRRG